MCIVGAIIGAGVAGAGASIFGSSEAANATKSSTNAAINEENAALAQQKAEAAPYTALGQSAIPQLESLLGLGSGGSAGEQAALAATPGYQFTLQQGDQNTLNAATSAGLLNSGNTLEALDQYNAGLADQTYQQAVTNAQNAVTTGADAASGVSGAIGSTASNVANALTTQGQTTASTGLGLVAGLENSLSGTTNALTLNNTLASLENPANGISSPVYPGSNTMSLGGYTVNMP